MEILATTIFLKQQKKLFDIQKKCLNEAIKEVTINPLIGELKKGDLSDVKVFKFRITNQQILLSYTYLNETKQIILLCFDTHENFYRDLKNI